MSIRLFEEMSDIQLYYPIKYPCTCIVQPWFVRYLLKKLRKINAKVEIITLL